MQETKDNLSVSWHLILYCKINGIQEKGNEWENKEQSAGGVDIDIVPVLIKRNELRAHPHGRRR